MTAVFEKLRTLLQNHYGFQYDQIELETDFEKELGTDSREMLELINDIEIIFNIEISFDDIDEFIYSGRTIKVKDVVRYIKLQLDGEKARD